MERRLAAIISADVSGYSRLTAVDEEDTLASLNACRLTVSDLVAEHHGRIFGFSGDAFVAEFNSPVQAVRCTVAIQRALARHNEDRPHDRRLDFRIGINLGDVVVDGSDLLGDGVNVAARLQEVAAPRGICISGAIREQIQGKVSFPIVDLGERSLKNIPRPIRVYRVDWRMEDPEETGVLVGLPRLPEKPSIAVLPFTNMSGDPEQEYFADGLTDDIITALSRQRWFFVISRNSSFTYRGRAVDVKQVAREMGVRYVLEGSVRRAGNRVRVAAQLIDAETGAHLWAERYDYASSDVFALQDEVAESVAGAIEPELLISEGRRSGERRVADPDAYDCCIRGQWHHYQVNRDDLVEAEHWLRRALEIDPKYARSHMALARVLFGKCCQGHSADVEADRRQMCELAERAVSLDDRDPYCHYAVFAARLLSGDHRAAIAAAQRSIDINPNFALGHLALGWSRIYAGRFEDALDPILRATRLSPNDPWAFLFMSRIAVAHYHLDNFDEALHFANRALDVRRLHIVFAVTVPALAMLDRIDEARALAEQMEAVMPLDPPGYWKCIHSYADPADRERLYAGLRKAGVSI